MASATRNRLAYAPGITYQPLRDVCFPMARTFNDEGIENLSFNGTEPPSTLSCTIKYFGFRNPMAAILLGSRVSVAENSSFWQDTSFGSSKSDWKSGMLCKVCSHEGATASWWKAAEFETDSDEIDESDSSRDEKIGRGGGRMAERTCASQSWNDCANRRSASSMTKKRRCCKEKFGVPFRWSINRPGVQMRTSILLDPPW